MLNGFEVENRDFVLKDGVTQEDIFSFYKNCGWFEVETNDNHITIFGYSAGLSPSSKEFRTPEEDEKFTVPFPLDIEILATDTSTRAAMRSIYTKHLRALPLK